MYLPREVESSNATLPCAEQVSDIALHNTTKKGEVFKIRAVRFGGSACSALEITDEARQFMRKCVYHAL